MFRTFCLSLAVLTSALAGRSAAGEPSVSKTYLGSVTGTVVKVGSGNITVKVPRVVQSGVTRRRVGGRRGQRGRTITVPKYTTRQEEKSYPLSLSLTVKTTSGRPAKLDDLRPGAAVRLHGYSVKEWTPGEKAVTHFEIRRIDIPDSAVAHK